MMLARAHPHPRDERIRFEEATHTYYVDGAPLDASVSAVVHDAFPAFNAQATVDRLYGAWLANKQSRYFPLINYLKFMEGMDDGRAKQAICDLWTANGKAASGYGTDMHKFIELHLNQEPLPAVLPPEFAQYQAWQADHACTWAPYRTEFSIFSEKHMIGGQIDSLWVDADGSIIMVDWKISQDITKENRYREFGHPPLGDLGNTNFYHYSLQQSTYAWILAEEYGIKVSKMLLVQMHKSKPGYIVHECMDLTPRVDEVLARFREQRPAKRPRNEN